MILLNNIYGQTRIQEEFTTLNLYFERTYICLPDETTN